MKEDVISHLRYQQAQDFESAYWTSRQHDAVGIINDLESPFALAQHLQRDGYLRHQFRRFLDLGCGGLGIGILWLIQSEEAYGLDPLPVLIPETGCRLVDEFVSGVQKNTKYFTGKAESMLFDDDFFDLVVCNNVLDHVHDPYAILNEVKRVLSPDGLFAFAVDTHSMLGLATKKYWKSIYPDYGSFPGHPYEWTEDQMSDLLKGHGFWIESHTRRHKKGQVLGRVRRSTWLLRHA